MPAYTYLIGLDEPEYTAIQRQFETPILANEVLPRLILKDGELWADTARSARMYPISKVVYHGIYEDDFDFIAALALWGGPCLPNPRAMMDCRLKLPCLVRALQYTRFGAPLRGYASPHAYFDSHTERVAKWGNWHCGENKARFTGMWSSEQPSLIEPFLEGEAVRVLIIGEQAWQIKLEGDSWLKSLHHTDAHFMALDPELHADTEQVRRGFGLEIIANDYIVMADGSKHLLEVNHIPNVTRFPEVWTAYRDFVVNWLKP